MADDRKNFIIKEDTNGGVNIADEVVAIIAGLAATEVDGVASLAGNLTNDIISKAGGNKLSKGVRIISEGDDSMDVRISLNMKMGYEIPKVSEQVQEKVKSSIESMTGLTVENVDIRIASVSVGNN